ncbi:Uncharacterised protein [Actinomyces bovis]|uniref:Uncharacterized protein n=1 Tax=Actinomyces bovis TaxID=1658 RepID=A0ABY1VQ11_9ACTO|nr:Uncharacterised protein [Actinomyces bovis]VEG56527.1 Uncharacterised protein [Actinomyces israelii]
MVFGDEVGVVFESALVVADVGEHGCDEVVVGEVFLAIGIGVDEFVPVVFEQGCGEVGAVVSAELEEVVLQDSAGDVEQCDGSRSFFVFVP